MKTCMYYKKQFIAYLHGELDSKRAAKVKQHLETCSACRADYEMYCSTLEALGDALVAVPVTVPERVWKPAVRTAESSAFSLRELWRNLSFQSSLAAAAIAVLFFLISGSIVVFKILPKTRYELAVSMERKALEEEEVTVASGMRTRPMMARLPEMNVIPVPSFESYGASSESVAALSPGRAAYTDGLYDSVIENSFQSVADHPSSSFPLMVDCASFANVRCFLENNQLPPVSVVRAEEMINYFGYDYPQPQNDEPFSVSVEVAGCPWNAGHQLAMVGLQGATMDVSDLPTQNLVFLLDVSGSMYRPDKLPLLKGALRLVADQIRPQDRMSIVAYSEAAGLVLEPTSDRARIIDAIDRLQAGGSSVKGSGIELAYRTALENVVEGGNNRVILATDGDVNAVWSGGSGHSLMQWVKRQGKAGIFLSVLGMGAETQWDRQMARLADAGKGNYTCIDNILSAKQQAISEMGGSLKVLARDVNVEVAFNAQHVKSYRLMGYEECGAAAGKQSAVSVLGNDHSVTALYEIVAADNDLDEDIGDARLMTVTLCYSSLNEQKKQLVRSVLSGDSESPSENIRRARDVAEFALLLGNSEYKADADYASLIRRILDEGRSDRSGLLHYVEMAQRLTGEGARSEEP